MSNHHPPPTPDVVPDPPPAPIGVDAVDVDLADTQVVHTPGLRDLLRLRDFRLLWLGQALSNFGDGLADMALIFLINELTGSTAALATLIVVIAVPEVVLGMVAGVYVDRLDRKRLMVISDGLRAVIALAFIAVATVERLPLLFVLGFLQATVGVFFGPARMALVPSIVPRAALLSANSLGQMTSIVARLLGTAAAGLLVGLLGAYWPAFAINAGTFVLSVLLISRVVAPARPEREPQSGGVRAVWQQLVEGVQVIVRSRALVGMLVAAGVTMLGMGAVNVLLVPLLVNDLGVPETWFGLIELSQTSSMLLSSALVATLAARLRPTTIVSVGLVALGVLIALVAAVLNVWHIMLILFGVGWIMTPLSASFTTIMQTEVDDAVLGRAGAALNALIGGASLISMGAAGVLAESIGVRSVFVLSGAIAVLAGLLAALVFRGVESGGSVRAEARP